jgi:uncharacterized membrane protein YdjX (TVP38/TMEM64 family)
MRKTLFRLFNLVALIGFFGLSVYLTRIYADDVPTVMAEHLVSGVVLYVGLTVLSIVVAPVNTFFLLPIAVTLWGSLAAAFLSIAGWTIGSVLVYEMTRRYGRPFVLRFVAEETINGISKHIPAQYLFLFVVLARMLLPVDILSYALGLVAPLSLGAYTLATALGVTPFALLFAFALESASNVFLVLVGALAVLCSAIGYYVFRTQTPLHGEEPVEQKYDIV